jgi:hypothetical protein
MWWQLNSPSTVSGWSKSHSFISPRTSHRLNSSTICSERHSFLDALRDILEECLAEDARPEILQRHLPDVRNVIANLLPALRDKQSTFWKLVSERKCRLGAGSHSHHEDRSSVSSYPGDAAGSQGSPHRSNPDPGRTSGSSLGKNVTTPIHGTNSPLHPLLVAESDGSEYVNVSEVPQSSSIGDTDLLSSTPHQYTFQHTVTPSATTKFDRQLQGGRLITRPPHQPFHPPVQMPQQSPAVPGRTKIDELDSYLDSQSTTTNVRVSCPRDSILPPTRGQLRSPLFHFQFFTSSLQGNQYS